MDRAGVWKSWGKTGRSNSKLPILFVTALKIKNVKVHSFDFDAPYFVSPLVGLMIFILPAITVVDLQE